MTTGTRSELTEEVIANLRELVRINIDSRQRLLWAADVIDGEALAELFRGIAAERCAFADELKMYIPRSVNWLSTDRSFASRIHQCWMNCRVRLKGGNPHVVLIEAESGESRVREAYEDVLKDHPGSALSDVLHSQYVVVKQEYDQIRDLYDAYARKQVFRLE